MTATPSCSPATSPLVSSVQAKWGLFFHLQATLWSESPPHINGNRYYSRFNSDTHAAFGCRLALKLGGTKLQRHGPSLHGLSLRRNVVLLTHRRKLNETPKDIDLLHRNWQLRGNQQSFRKREVRPLRLIASQDVDASTSLLGKHTG
jgi:hypothetical protein